jgi:hypothetical protein
MARLPCDRGRRPAAPAFLLAVLCLAGSGCGKGHGEVSGKVTYQGKPLTSGTVSLMDSDGSVQSAAIQPDGRYSFAAVVEGPATLVVTCTERKGEGLSRAEAPKVGNQKRLKNLPGGVTRQVPKGTTSLIPLDYGDFSKSKFKIKVEPKVHQLDLPLTDSGK